MGGTFTIQCRTFTAGRLNAFTQFHIVRRLAPLTGRLAGLASALPNDGGDLSAEDAERVLEPLGLALRDIPDADADYILNACLDVTEIQRSDGGWDKVRKNGVLMHELDLTTLIGVAFHVVKENLGGFFDAMPSLVKNRAAKA